MLIICLCLDLAISVMKYSPELDEIHRYKLVNQVTFPAIVRLIDRYLPNNLKKSGTENQLALSKN